MRMARTSSYHLRKPMSVQSVLATSKTTFHVTDDDNNLKAKVRSSGMYLNEDGSAGSVQQVDF